MTMPSALNGVLLLGRPLAGRVRRFSVLKWHVLSVIYDVSNNEYGGWPREIEVAQFLG
jgi:hypothetical protein